MKKTILLILSLILSINLIYSQETEKKELKPALLVIDVQNAYMQSMDQSEKESAIKFINWSIMVFENYKLPIIRVYHQDKIWGPAEDSEEFKFSSEINIKEDYPMVIKHYGNAFTKTDLDKILKEKGINTVYLCGLSATGCVLASYIGANDHDYKAFMIKDALLSPSAEHTDFIETIMSTVDLETIMFMFDYMK
jgi:nicotinamidase-related amidase